MTTWTSRADIGAALIKRARAAAVATIRRQPLPKPSLQTDLIPVRIEGIGVTLSRRGVVGCSVSTQQDLDAAVVAAAAAAAVDRRYPSLSANDCHRLRVKVSVLYRPRYLGPCSKEIAVRHLRLGLDSIGASQRGSRAIFLDYVAREQSWTKMQLVTALLHKAQLKDTVVQWTFWRTVCWPQRD